MWLNIIFLVQENAKICINKAVWYDSDMKYDKILKCSKLNI